MKVVLLIGFVVVATVFAATLIYVFDFIYERKWENIKLRSVILTVGLFILILFICSYLLYDVITIALRGQYMMGLIC